MNVNDGALAQQHILDIGGTRGPWLWIVRRLHPQGHRVCGLARDLERAALSELRDRLQPKKD